MFGKKKDKPIKVMHYEGIDDFPSDYPCTLEIADNVLKITRIKPETTVTLPLNRIKSFTAMEEKNYMLKYHGQATATSKVKGINKYYLVVTYDKGLLAFWGTAKEYGKFIELQKTVIATTPSQIEL